MFRPSRSRAAAFLLLLLAGCHAEKPDWARQDRQAAVPAAACAEIAKAVAQMRDSRGADIGDTGEATIALAAWNLMSADQHEQLARTVAFQAACKAGAQSDAQPVVIRSDEGNELARRAISTRVDPGALLREPPQ